MLWLATAAARQPLSGYSVIFAGSSETRLQKDFMSDLDGSRARKSLPPQHFMETVAEDDAYVTVVILGTDLDKALASVVACSVGEGSS